MTESGMVEIEIARIEAMMGLLIGSGDMTPMAAMQLRKLWAVES